MDITHCHNQRPVYETSDGEKYEWTNPMHVQGETNQPSFNNYHPFIIDIETSAELGQRPILLVGYNTLEDHLIILYAYGYQGYTVDRDRIEELAYEINPSSLTIQNISQSNFEKYVLKPISKWNKKAKERKDRERISLVAHNAPFDIPMMGTPDDALLDNPKIGEQYEMAVQYKNIKMVGHRAGQFGHIYTFLDSSKQYESLHIPVGDTLVGTKSLWLASSGKLKNACEAMDIDLEVSESEEHGNLTDEYVEYCINDVWATKKLYDAINARLRKIFGNLPLEHVYSTASIGKYFLRKMNYKRVGYEQGAVDRISEAYFGGRTDAHTTGEIIENLQYTDILSQYPTVSSLTNVWDYMQCEYVGIEQIEVSDLPEVDDLTKPKEWSEIADYYVKIDPNGATLPVRTPHIEETTKVITSKVESDEDIMYHYMDIIASDLLDNERKVDIKAAWKVYAQGEQNLESAKIGDIEIEAYDNVMEKCIQSRKNIQLEQGYKDETTKSLKITANSLYGVSAERIVKDTPDLVGSERHDFASESGFYNPHVATTITAAGRLQLALGERTALDNGGRMHYCDTDSLIIDEHVTDEVIEAFSDLNPYDGGAGDLQVLEREKDESGNLYAVGTKKYIFFSDNGEPLEVKEHGLGNYDNLRDEETIKQLWATIMQYDIGENPLNIEMLYEYKLDEKVLWSFNASTRSMRTLIDQFTDDHIRYGDWIQSTLSYDGDIRYIALNLMEKENDEKVCKVITDNEEIQDAYSVTFSNMINDDSLKTVNDVVMKFVQDAKTKSERPEVRITEKKAVTKESTSRKDIFMAKLQQSFKENMETAVRWLFN